MWSEFPPKLPHYFPKDCFGGSSDLARTGSTLFSGRFFWRQLRFCGNHNKKTDTTTLLYQLRFGGNWLHIIFRWIVLEGAQIKRLLAREENFLWTRRKFGFNKKICTKLNFPPQQIKCHNHTTVLYTKYLCNTKNYFPPEQKKLTQHHNCMVL